MSSPSPMATVRARRRRSGRERSHRRPGGLPRRWYAPRIRGLDGIAHTTDARPTHGRGADLRSQTDQPAARHTLAADQGLVGRHPWTVQLAAVRSEHHDPRSLAVHERPGRHPDERRRRSSTGAAPARPDHPRSPPSGIRPGSALHCRRGLNRFRRVRSHLDVEQRLSGGRHRRQRPVLGVVARHCDRNVRQRDLRVRDVNPAHHLSDARYRWLRLDFGQRSEPGQRQRATHRGTTSRTPTLLRAPARRAHSPTRRPARWPVRNARLITDPSPVAAAHRVIDETSWARPDRLTVMSREMRSGFRQALPPH